jgi:uncharacterized NAD(P)/FAD-binding protein YdhS
VHLLHRAERPLRVLLVERTGDFGPGVAYSTTDDEHLLNVPAERMSAFCEAPSHFRSWAHCRVGRVAPCAFLPRRLYGEYLREMLAEAESCATAGCRLERFRGEVVAVAGLGCELELRPASGERLNCDRAVLALGWMRLAEAEHGLPEAVIDPLIPGVLAAGGPAESTLVVGTGLTAIDAVLSSCAGGASGGVVAVSRRGLLPQAHLPGLRSPAPAPHPPPPPVTLARWSVIWWVTGAACSRRASTGATWSTGCAR